MKILVKYFAVFLLINSVHANTRDLYIDLMKRCVTNTIYEDPGYYQNAYDPNAREIGSDWPRTAHTMIGMQRLNNIHYCVKEIIENNIAGDLIETGVWRGGSTIFMRALLKAYGDTTRKVWVADSFEGLPPPNVMLYPADIGFDLYKNKELAISLEQVQSNFKKYDLLDEQVVFLKGFFRDSLPTAPIRKLALLRLDGDLYESTMDALASLYPKLSVGGFLIIDDYPVAPCVQAVNDYRSLHGITDPIIPIGRDGAYWKKTR